MPVDNMGTCLTTMRAMDKEMELGADVAPRGTVVLDEEGTQGSAPVSLSSPHPIPIPTALGMQSEV